MSDAQTGTLLWVGVQPGISPGKVVFSLDGKHMVTSHFGTARIWRVGDGAYIEKVVNKSHGVIDEYPLSPIFSTDGESLVIAGLCGFERKLMSAAYRVHDIVQELG